MPAVISHELPAGTGFVVRVVATDRGDGDFNVRLPRAQLASMRSALAPTPWTWLNQVHGATVLMVDRPGQWAGHDGDGAVTATSGCALAVHTADCAPVVIAGNGVVGVAHAGWRGIVAGIIPNTVDLIRTTGGAGPLSAYLGPCIRPGSYEFSEIDLDAVAGIVGDSVRGLTAGGRPALDLGAAVFGVLASSGVDRITDAGVDTSCVDYFSHRTRSDAGRQVTVAWIEALS